MKKILILYFSGAGATLNSIKYMQTCINNITGCSAYIHSMENDLEENINNYESFTVYDKERNNYRDSMLSLCPMPYINFIFSKTAKTYKY